MKKIMFNTKLGLEQAVLEGRKTQTRRLVSLDSIDKLYIEKSLFSVIHKGKIHPYLLNKYSKYKEGKIVAIAQSYKDIGYQPTDKTAIIRSRKIEFVEFQEHKGWNNKMFVSCDNMLHFIRITKVRIERLQDISDEDCLAEGIENLPDGGGLKPYAFYDNSIRVKTEREGVCHGWYRDFDTPREAYAVLIDKISGKGTWEKNPYVWVYDFELVK